MIWGTIGPGVDLVHERSGLSPLTIGAYRSVAALAVLWLAVVARGRVGACRALMSGEWRRVVLRGLLTASFMLLFFVAVLAVGVSVATVVALGVAPVLLLVLTTAQQGRRPSPVELATVVTAVVGLALVGFGGDGPGGIAGGAVVGLIAAVASGAAYGLSADVASFVSRGHDALAITTMTMTVAAVVLIPGGLLVAGLRGERLGSHDPVTWVLLGYLGAVTMALAYVLLFAGLRSMPSGAAVVATLLEPVTAVVIAVTFLGETLTPAMIVGSLLILAAIAGLGRRAEPQPQ